MTIKTYAQVNIGRNRGTEPMDAEEWARFIDATRMVLAATAVSNSITWEDTMVHLGEGIWVDDHGLAISEDSAYISAYHADGFRVDMLNDLATTWARHWGQDMVAVLSN